MLFAVMQHVAALTVGFEIALFVVARIVIEVGGRQHDFGRKDPVIFRDKRMRRQGERPAPTVSPCGRFLVPPTTIPQVKDQAAVWATAMLASALCATKRIAADN